VIAALRGDITHVECNDHRPPEALQLEHQAQVEPQIGRIDHAHEQVRRRLARMTAEHDIAGDSLIKRGGLETVGSGQVDHPEGPAGARADQPPFLALDGHARVIGDFLPTARETIEECGLAAVGDAD
jgi:hypothetical protein